MYVLELVGEADALPLREAARAATGVVSVAPGLATARTVDVGRLRGLALVRAADALVARTSADVGDAVAALGAAPLDRSGSVAVRARDVRGTAGIDTRRAERALGDVLVERGFTVDLEDPDHELRALFASPARDGTGREGDDDGVCLLGWLAVESVRDFAERAPTDRPFFQPGSMDPMLARAAVNVALGGLDTDATPGQARGGAGQTLLDPMCGTGGLLVEAGLVGARPLGADAQPEMVRGAARNLAAALPAGGWDLLAADATRLPLADGAVAAAAFDVPYERQSTVAGGSLGALLAGALAESRRVAGRAVVVADRDWSGAARDAGWTVADRIERPVHRSLVRHFHVLE